MVKDGSYNAQIAKLSMTLIILLVVFAPLFRGLFFEAEMSMHMIGVSITSIITALLFFFIPNNHHKRNSKRASVNLKTKGQDQGYDILALFKSPYFWCMSLITLSYGLSIFTAVNPREALFAFLRHIDYLILFIMIYLTFWVWSKEESEQSASRNLSIHWAFAALIMAGFLVAAAGLLAGFGIIPIAGGVWDKRIASTLQYPNTMAAYLSVTVLFAYHQVLVEKKWWLSGLYSMAGFVIMLTIFGSQSRGVWVLLPFFFLFFLLGQIRKIKAILLISIQGIVGLALGILLITPAAHKGVTDYKSFLLTLIGVLFIGVPWALIEKWIPSIKSHQNTQSTQKDHNKKRRFALFAGSAILILMIGAGTFLAANSLIIKTDLENNPLLSRAISINLGEQNFQERVVFYTESLTMIKERPVLGWGGGGWKSAYRAYQSFLYHSTEVHNHFLQLWLEAGTITFVSFVTLFILVFLSLIGILVKKKEADEALNSSSLWTMGIAILGLGVHSLMDFNLSLSAVAILLWSLFAMFAFNEYKLGYGLSGYLKDSFQFLQATKNYRWAASLMVLLAIPLIFTAIQLRSASADYAAFSNAAQKNNGSLAEPHLKSAIAADPLKVEYIFVYSQLLYANAERTQDAKQKQLLIDVGTQMAQKAVTLDSYNASHHLLLARYYLMSGKLDMAALESTKAYELHPWVVTTQEEAALLLTSIGIRNMLASQNEIGEQSLNKVIAIANEAATKKQKLPPNLARLWRHQPDMVLTPKLALQAGKAALLINDIPLAQSFLQKASMTDDPKAKAFVQLWQAALLKKSGTQPRMDVITQIRSKMPELEVEAKLLEQLGLL